MAEDWNKVGKQYEQRAHSFVKGGPISVVVKIAVLLFVIGAIFGTVGFVAGWFGEAAQVAKEEFGPRAMLKKYEQFKDQAAVLESKLATIQRMERRPKSIKEDYGEEKRSEWAREDRQQYNLWITEIEGVAASFNTLAAEYNANMAKFNYRFANAGDLPEGADKPLPRAFKSYLYE